MTVIDAKGSTPREAGAAMIVSACEAVGTIGGGALEYDAIAHARSLLNADSEVTWLRDSKTYPLGPRLGQCCGGQERLLFERFGAQEVDFVSTEIDINSGYFARLTKTGSAPIRVTGITDLGAAPRVLREKFQTLIGAAENKYILACGGQAEDEWFIEPIKKKLLPIYLYGAGHVGREVVRVFEGLAVEIVWIDTDASRFPDLVPAHATRMVVASPKEAVAYASDDVFHVVMSYSHPLDLEICHAVLKRGRFRYLGLIGSMTKRARFLKRLCELGVSEAALSRLTCPLGADGPTSKDPAVIAIALAAEILRLAEGRGR